MASSNKEPPYVTMYFVAIVVALGLHYVVMAQSSVHPTLHVVVAFLFFTLLMGVSTILFERSQKKNKE